MNSKFCPNRAMRMTRISSCAIKVGSRLLLGMTLSASVSLPLAAQAPSPQAAAAASVVGTIIAVGNGVLTVKTDAGAERKVTVPDGIKMQRIAPGEKDLRKATIIQFSDLAMSDRVLVRLAPEPATDPVTAISLIAIPQADLAQKQQRDREEWQRNGVGGLVKSVNAGTGVITITSGAGPAQKTFTLHTTPATVLRRYAIDSVSFDQAKAASIETIQVGDQLRARGTKNADGTELAADEVVSGSFRNISGTVASVNQSAMTITLKDLATKQTVTVHVGPDAQMRKLPETMAKMIAASTNSNVDAKADAKAIDHKTSADAASNSSASPGPPASTDHSHQWPGQPGSGQSGSGQPAGSPTGDHHSPDSPSAMTGATSSGASNADAFPRHGSGDPQQMLSRAPAIHLSDLQKGDAVMLVSTQGSSDVTAITLLAGVEPLLQAPASTQNMLLSNWSMNSGSAEAAQ